jgi:RND family efflux transporter MFP subunit
VKKGKRNLIVFIVAIAAAAGLGWMIFNRLQTDSGPAGRRAGASVTPVEVAPIARGPMEWRQTFTGTLESPSKLMVAPKISGRIVKLNVDLGDRVTRGQVVAGLDDDEYIQAVNLARADLEVAKANLVEAKSALDIAARKLKRMEQLRQRNVASESEFDAAQAEHLGKLAQVDVSKAQLARAEAALETARIRLGYTQVAASWADGSGHRVVGDRYADEGETVSANDPLISVVQLDPIKAVIFVTEKDYVHLRPGQPAWLTTDAFPGKRFEARIDRISPVFRETSRQAKIELRVVNPEHRLKPGMFVRATVALDRVENAIIVPKQALTQRNDRDGVFVVTPDGRSVAWREVSVGIQEGDRVQVTGEALSGRVVTLGQQLVDDGSRITIPGDTDGGPSVRSEAAGK